MEVDSQLACGIVGNIGQLWLDEQFVDLQIHVGDILFNCHRLILCACSKFFKVLLKSEVKGETERPAKKVTIRGISPEIFQLVLKAIYKGENGLTTENMMEFWHAAHQLQIPVLVSKCETFVSDHLTQENFVNIHQNALLLKSRNMTRATHQFVAQNFESFKDQDILLQQPVCFIEDIIGGDSLVGQNQDHVVEFVLKWVDYELCERETERICGRETEHVCGRETEHVCAKSTVEDVSAQTNEVTRNKNGGVEVIFHKPHSAFDESGIRNLSGEHLVRKQSFKKLLKLIRFAEVSKESLEILADNDLVMGSKETRDIVKHALELVNSAPTSAVSISASSTSASSTSAASTSESSTSEASTSEASIDTEDTVVFVTSDANNVIYAYSLDREDIFKFYTVYGILNIHTQNNKLLCCLQYDASTDPYSLKMIEYPFSELMSMIGYVRTNSVIVGDFCYTFKGNMYRKNIEGGNWYRLFAPAEPMPSPRLTVLKDSILYYNPKRDEHGNQKVYCFNTKSRRHWHVITYDYKDCDFATFTYNDQLYILFGNGVILNVTNIVISPTEAFTLPKYSEFSKTRLLWNFQVTIYGTVVHHDTLVVFGDLTSVLASEIYECKIPGLTTVKFVHLFGLLTECHPLVIPKKLLTQQM